MTHVIDSFKHVGTLHVRPYTLFKSANAESYYQ